MIIAACLNGWASFSAPTRTATIVRELLAQEGRPCEFIGLKSRFFWGRSTQIAKFVQRFENRHDDLLLVGKSLGAKHIVERVLNLAPGLRYRSIHLITIDPNWPTWRDWTPNLNGQVLHVTEPVDGATNLYVLAENKRQQAGALLGCLPGVPCKNVIVVGADHYSVVESPLVKQTIRKVIKSLSG